MISVRAMLDIWCPPFLLKWKGRVVNSPLGYRLARGAFWSLAGSILARGLGLLSGIFVARILGKVGFGQLGMIQSTVGMFGTLAGLSLGVTATKHVAEDKASNPARAGRIIGLASVVAWVSGGLATIVLLLLAPWLASRSLAAPELSGLLQLGSLLLLLGGVNGAQTGALAGFEAFRTIARVSLVAGVLSFPITISCALLLGVRGAVWAQILTLLINSALNYLALRKVAAQAHVPLGYSHCWQEWPILWKFSLPTVLGGVLAGPVSWASAALLVNQPHGYSQMGIYNAVTRMKGLPELVLSMVSAPLLPILSEQFAHGQTAAYSKTLRYAFGLSFVLIVPVSLIQIAGPAITMLPFGQEYRENSAPVVQWLMVQAAFLGIFFPFGSIILSMNRTWFGFWYSVWYSILLLALAWLLIPRFGGAGLASAMALSYLAASLVCVIYIRLREKSFVADVRLFPAIWAVAVSAAFCAALARLVDSVAATILGAALVCGLTVSCVRHALPKSL
jgi:O-antigen/teichoic acid export membrane protein